MADPNLVRIGDLEGVPDGMQAANIRTPGSESQQAVDERVQPVAEAVIAGNQSVIEAAAQRALTDAGLTRTVVSTEDDTDDAVYKFAQGGAAGLNAEGHLSRRTLERAAANAFMAPRTSIVRDAAGRVVSETIGGLPIRNILRDPSGRVFQYTAGDRTVSVARDAAGRLTGEQ